MNFRTLIASSFCVTLATLATPLMAQTMDVDQADTIDFESFHKDKKEAVKVWDKKSDAPTKAYSDKPADTKSATSTSNAVTPVANDTTSSADTKSPVAVPQSASKRYEIRERYTLTRSASTPYSAFYVIEPLYKQAAQLCAKGWKKIAERSEPIESDYYLYYEIECL